MKAGSACYPWQGVDTVRQARRERGSAVAWALPCILRWQQLASTSPLPFLSAPVAMCMTVRRDKVTASEAQQAPEHKYMNATHKKRPLLESYF